MTQAIRSPVGPIVLAVAAVLGAVVGWLAAQRDAKTWREAVGDLQTELEEWQGTDAETQERKP